MRLRQWKKYAYKSAPKTDAEAVEEADYGAAIEETRGTYD